VRCFFWGEYTPYEHTNGKKWNFSDTNQLISNLKKKMDRNGTPEWRHKQKAIQQVATQFAASINWRGLHNDDKVAVIPIPPSKARTDAMFDPRMLQIAQSIAALTGLPLDIRDCLSFSGAYAASHETDDRPSPDDLYGELTFNSAVGKPAHRPGKIVLLDDMLTTGAHYVATTRKLAEVFPNVEAIGAFVARRIVPNPFADFDFDEL
jgi:predicted amidophosphoribosyltransferase